MTEAGVQVFDPVWQWPYLGLSDRVFSIFFKIIFDQNVNGHTTVSQIGFFFNTFFHMGCQWPYHGPGLWDWGMVIDVQSKLSEKKPGLTDSGMATDVLVKNDFKKKMEKNPVCGTMVWPLADRVKNLLEKKWPGLSDSGCGLWRASVLISYFARTTSRFSVKFLRGSCKISPWFL